MMRILRAQCLAAGVSVALLIGLSIPAAAQDAASAAKKAAEADAKAAAEDKAAAEAKATAGGSPPVSLSPAARRGIRAGDVQKVFTLKHVRVDDMARVLSVFPAEISGMERGTMHVLSVSAAPAVVAAIEETIKRLDLPSPPIRSVELTAYLLECSTAGDGGTVATDLQDVVAQLKRTFNYSGCVSSRTLFTRAADGSRIQLDSREGSAGMYSLNGMLLVDSSEPTVVIRIRQLNFSTSGPSQGGRLTGDIDIRDGQKVVLGRLGSTESGKHQIVVLAAKLVQ
jgi:hypothetical protein